MISNKVYNIIKWIVITVLPASGVLIGALGAVYNWNGTDLLSWL